MARTYIPQGFSHINSQLRYADTLLGPNGRPNLSVASLLYEVWCKGRRAHFPATSDREKSTDHRGIHNANKGKGKRANTPPWYGPFAESKKEAAVHPGNKGIKESIRRIACRTLHPTAAKKETTDEEGQEKRKRWQLRFSLQ